MNAPDPLAEFYAASPRHSAALGGRSGVHGQVDSALNELQVPATLDQDGDWKLQTDVGPFLLVVDKQSSDLIVIQTLQSIERKVKNFADEMHGLLALNFEARGIARFGIVKDDNQNLLVLTARLAPDEISTQAVQRLLGDCFRLSRRLDELLGNAPKQPAGQPGGWQTADAALAQAESAGGPPAAEPAAAPSPEPAAAPSPEQAPAEAPAAETVFAQPVPQAPPAEPEPAAAEPAPVEPAAPEPAPAEPAAPEPGPAQPATPAAPAQPAPAETHQPPAAAEPEPSYPAPAAPEPEPTFPPPAAPDPALAYPAPDAAYQAPAQPEAPAPPQQSLPPANWYNDPYYQARLRYWDGQQWTEHVAQ